MDEEIRTISIGDFLSSLRAITGISGSENNTKKQIVEKKEEPSTVKVSEKEEGILSQNLDDKSVEDLIEDDNLEENHLEKEENKKYSIFSGCEEFLKKENLEKELEDFYKTVDPGSKEVEIECIKAIQNILSPEQEDDFKAFFKAKLEEA